MQWFVVHTKPRQETRALVNLQRQGFECFLPTIPKKRVSRKVFEIVHEPLFSRYVFIELDTQLSGRSWAPIRSTLGVSKLVTFGTEPARVSSDLIALLREQQHALAAQPLAQYKPGDIVKIKDGPFKGIEAVYQMDDGEMRALVLIELLQKPTRMQIDIANLQKAS
jgi:transcriptional antiterminator RfaH